MFFNKFTDARFKTNKFSVMFFTDWDEISRADYAAAGYILTDSCKKFPSYSALSKRLAELYDASLTSSTTISNFDSRMTTISADVLDDRYALDGEKPEEEICGIIRECILAPNAEHGEFDAGVTALMKSELIDAIDSVINDKASYAAKKCAETAFVGEPIALSPNGTREQAERVTPRSAYAAYERMLETAHIEILCAGCSEFSAAERIFTEMILSLDSRRDKIHEITATPSRLKPSPVTVSDSIPMEQAILRMCFKNPELTDKPAYMMLTMILGGMTMSRFFRNIREKQSLCYYCAASGSFYHRLLTAYAGVKPKNVSRTAEAIKRELADIVENGVTDDEIAAARLEIRNTLQSMNDSARLMGMWYVNQLLEQKPLSPEELWEEIEKVTSDRIKAAAGGFKLDTVYTLSGGEENV